MSLLALPDQVTTLVNELGRTRLEVNCKVKAEFGKNLFALNVVVTIPVPETTAHADVQTKIGAPPPPPSAGPTRCTWPFRTFCGQSPDYGNVEPNNNGVQHSSTTAKLSGLSRAPLGPWWSVLKSARGVCPLSL